RQQASAAGQVARGEDLEVVRRRVPGEGKLLLALADDLVEHGRRDPVGAEPADGEVVAVVDVLADGLGDRRHLGDQPPPLLPKVLAGAAGRRVHEQRAVAREGGGHGCPGSLVVGGGWQVAGGGWKRGGRWPVRREARAMAGGVPSLLPSLNTESGICNPGSV